jgi:hypothetical protein
VGSQLDLALPETDSARNELAINPRVWNVLYPDTEVHIGGAGAGDDEVPAA